MGEEHLVSRAVAALFAGNHGPEGAVEQDTATEFRYGGDRGVSDGVAQDSEGNYRVVRWTPGGEPEVKWWTNSAAAANAALALDARILWLKRRGISWLLPEPHQLPPGFTSRQDGGVTSVSWDDGRHWARVVGAQWEGSVLAAIAPWLAYSADEIIESCEHPPGPIGLVPYRRGERITVDEALRET